MLPGAREGRFRALRRHYGMDLLRPNGSGHQISHAHQIVGGACKRENPIHFQRAAMPHFAQQGDGLQPAEAFFDALPFLLADGITHLSRGAAVDGTPTSSSAVLRYVWRHAQVATLAHEFRRVIALVATHGHPPVWNAERDLERSLERLRTRDIIDVDEKGEQALRQMHDPTESPVLNPEQGCGDWISG